MKLTKLAIPSDSKLPFIAGILFAIYALVQLLAVALIFQYLNQIPIYYLVLKVIFLLTFLFFTVICFFVKRNVKYFLIPTVVFLAYQAVSFGFNIYQKYKNAALYKEMGITPSTRHWNFFTVNNTVRSILIVVVLLLFLLLIIGLKSAKPPCLIAIGLYTVSALIPFVATVVDAIQQFGKTSAPLYVTTTTYNTYLCGLLFGLAFLAIVLSIKEVNAPESPVLENE